MKFNQTIKFLDHLANGCLEQLPDRIKNAWKSAESFFINNQINYYQLTQYSCDFGGSNSTVEIECRDNQWQKNPIPVCPHNKSIIH